MSDGIVLCALDGANPLAFLAALGTLRLVGLKRPDTHLQMAWERVNGAWRPRLSGLDLDQNGLSELLMGAEWAPAHEFQAALGKNLTVAPKTFAPFVQEAGNTATRKDRRAADFAASFGCEVCIDKDKDRIEYTDLCFITGSGHQDFLGTICALAEKTTAAHLRDALFGNWNPEKGSSMRWDPSDIAEYALKWDDPGPKGAWAVWGANRLAIEALPFFPTMPTAEGLRTTGFKRRGRADEFTWPIWARSSDAETVRSLVALEALQDEPPDHEKLHAMGVDEIYRAVRDRVGQGANFKVSFRPACAV